MMTTTEATLVKTMTETKDKTQRLFKLSSSLCFDRWDFGDDASETTVTPKMTEFILVSRVIAMDHGDWETLIFPADEEGEVLDWGELWGVRGWEHIGTTLNNFLESNNEERLQTSPSLLD